ncbi:MAG: dephospho-CoA kinase [Lachnospiraceae bacterium]|nr:dephospho-CoA kinase [Lachnospiraceae bacterium]
MKTIGITGGVGAGKSLVLNYLQNHYNARVYLADNIANDLKLPGQSCYDKIIDLLGKDITDSDGLIDKNKMAEKIFSHKELLNEVNRIIHPAVKEYVLSRIELERKKGEIDYFILEAALLIEEGYDQILDELWYIHADTSVRSQRLKETRNYTMDKINHIMASQLSETEFRKHCKVVINNNSDEEALYSQIDHILEEK